MKIQATYIGSNEKLGYDYGGIYKLAIQKPSTAGDIEINASDGRIPNGRIIYSSITTFLQNWTNIENR